MTAAWIDQNGGDSKTVKYVELPTTLAAASIVSGRVDGALMLDPILGSAVATGGCRILAHPYDIVAKYWDASLWFSLRSYAEQNADIMTRFRAALRESIIYAQAHRDEVVTAVSKFTGMEPSVVSTMALDIGTTLTPQDVQPVIDFAARHKLIASSFRAAEIIDAGALRRT